MDQYLSTLPDGAHLLLFGDDNQDTTYLENELLLPLIQQSENETLEAYVFVDMTDYQEVSVTRWQNRWGFSAYPALVLINVSNGSVSITDSISVQQNTSSDSQSTNAQNSVIPLTQNEIKNWLIKNNLWSGRLDYSAS